MLLNERIWFLFLTFIKFTRVLLNLKLTKRIIKYEWCISNSLIILVIMYFTNPVLQMAAFNISLSIIFYIIYKLNKLSNSIIFNAVTISKKTDNIKIQNLRKTQDALYIYLKYKNEITKFSKGCLNCLLITIVMCSFDYLFYKHIKWMKLYILCNFFSSIAIYQLNRIIVNYSIINELL